MKANQLKMKQSCQTSDPCGDFGGRVSGCAGSLTSIGGSHKLNPTAAKSYLQMVEAAKKDGVQWKISDSFRPLKIQCNIMDWDHFESTNKKRKKGTSGTPVAFPGESNHGWGSAVDIGVKYNDSSWNWLTENASKFGFSNPFKNPRTEPWHWEHVESAKALKSGAPSLNSGENVTVPTSDDTTKTDTTTKDSDKKVDMFDILSGGGITSWLDQFFPKGGKPDVKESITEDVQRIKDLMKKVL